MTSEKLLPLEVRLAASEAHATGGKADTAPMQALFEAGRASLGPAHQTTVHARLELGILQRVRSEQEDSEASLRYVLEQRPPERFAADHLRLQAQSQLASLLAGQQRWREAEATLEQALAAAEAARRGPRVPARLRDGKG
jgi:hypothetical protein